MKKYLLTNLVLIISLLGCATPPKEYEGETPNFNLQGEQAVSELEKFTLNSSYFSSNSYFVEMGQQEDIYTFDSLKPLMTSVSPSSFELIETSREWTKYSLYALAGAVGFLAYKLIDGDDWSSSDKIIHYSLLGFSLTSTIIVAPALVSRGASIYNQDLREKFAPGLSFRLFY